MLTLSKDIQYLWYLLSKVLEHFKNSPFGGFYQAATSAMELGKPK